MSAELRKKKGCPYFLYGCYNFFCNLQRSLKISVGGGQQLIRKDFGWDTNQGGVFLVNLYELLVRLTALPALLHTNNGGATIMQRRGT
jgi:hypothetical protein